MKPFIRNHTNLQNALLGMTIKISFWSIGALFLNMLMHHIVFNIARLILTYEKVFGKDLLLASVLCCIVAVSLGICIGKQHMVVQIGRCRDPRSG